MLSQYFAQCLQTLTRTDTYNGKLMEKSKALFHTDILTMLRLNTKVLKDSSKQIDFTVNELASSNWIEPILTGEGKSEDQQDDKHICLLDLIRIGAIFAESIGYNQYDAVLGVHIVGLQMTLYITTLQASRMYGNCYCYIVTKRCD